MRGKGVLPLQRRGASYRMSPFEAILDQSRELALERLCAALATTLDKADEHIGALLDKTQDADPRALLNEARSVVSARRADIEGEFPQHWQDEYQKRCSKVRKALQSPEDEGEVE